MTGPGDSARSSAEDVPRRSPPLPGPVAAPGDPAALVQGSLAWAAARLGRVTASRVADVVARTRAGFSAARAAYLAQLLAERLSGRAAEPYLTPAMAWGRRHEAGARAAYEFFCGVEVALCGFLRHPGLAMAGASPDGLVGNEGLLEIKCPTTAAHVDLLLKGAIPERHQIQMQWQMACSGRAWCDYLSFDPRRPNPSASPSFASAATRPASPRSSGTSLTFSPSLTRARPSCDAARAGRRPWRGCRQGSRPSLRRSAPQHRHMGRPPSRRDLSSTRLQPLARARGKGAPPRANRATRGRRRSRSPAASR